MTAAIRITALFATAVVLGATAVASPHTALAATVDTNASYVLVNRNSGKALDVYNLATTDGAPINQYSRNDGAWQQWQFVDSGGGCYRLQSRAQRQGARLARPPPTASQLVQNDRPQRRTGQQFRLADSAGGHVRLINRNSGKAARRLDCSTADGAQVSQWTDLDGDQPAVAAGRLGAGAAGTFTNPIKRNGPDPWLQYHNGYYYLATTTWNSTITMRRSTHPGRPGRPPPTR